MDAATIEKVLRQCHICVGCERAATRSYKGRGYHSEGYVCDRDECLAEVVCDCCLANRDGEDLSATCCWCSKTSRTRVRSRALDVPTDVIGAGEIRLAKAAVELRSKAVRLVSGPQGPKVHEDRTVMIPPQELLLETWDRTQRRLDALLELVRAGDLEGAQQFAAEIQGPPTGRSTTLDAEGNLVATSWSVREMAGALVEHLDALGPGEGAVWEVTMPDDRVVSLRARWVLPVSERPTPEAVTDFC